MVELDEVPTDDSSDDSSLRIGPKTRISSAPFNNESIGMIEGGD